MSRIASVGELVYDRIVTPVFSADRRSYTCGCIVHGKGHAVKVIFLKYEIGKGIVGRAKPSAEMAALLHDHGHDLKEYINDLDRRYG